LPNLNKKQAAGFSVLSNLLLTLLKLAAGTLSGSMSIVAEAAHSAFDLAASLIAYVSVRISDRPADEGHPYGHHKIENISGSVEAALIFIVAAWIIYESVERILTHARVEYIPLGLAVMTVSLLMNIFVSRLLYRIAARTRSIALEADAAHLHSDVLTSIGVIVTLGVILFAREKLGVELSFLDPVVSIFIALYILRIAWELLRKSYPSLMDERARSDIEQKLHQLIRDFCADCYSFHKLRTRQAGSRVHIDFHLQFLPETPLEDAHLLCHDLIQKIEAEIPGSEVIVHIEPIEDRPGPGEGL
jgi:cation diffusion facilitator family transporter